MNILDEVRNQRVSKAEPDELQLRYALMTPVPVSSQDREYVSAIIAAVLCGVPHEQHEEGFLVPG